MAMLELHGENFSPHLKVWFGDMEAETMFRLAFIINSWITCPNFWCSVGEDTLNHEYIIVQNAIVSKF